MIEEPGSQYLQLDTVTASPEQGSSDSSPGHTSGGSPRRTAGYTLLQPPQPSQVDEQASQEVHYQDMEHGALTTLGHGYIDGVGGSPPQGSMSRLVPAIYIHYIKNIQRHGPGLLTACVQE